MNGQRLKSLLIPQAFINLQLNRTVINVIFVLSIIILFFANLGAYNQLKKLISGNDWVNHTHEVIETIDTCLYNTVDIESRQRGYLIRGDNQFLTDVDCLKGILKAKLEDLKELTEDNSEQKSRVQRFTELINQRLVLLNQVMQLKTANKLYTEEGEDTLNESQDYSESVKSLGQEIKSVELVLLKERNKIAINWASTSSQVLIIGSIISLLSLIIAFILANIELSNRNKLQKKFKTTQERLLNIIESTSDMIAALDDEERFIIFNEAYQNEFKKLFDKSLTTNSTFKEILQNVDTAKASLVKNWEDSIKHFDGRRSLVFKTVEGEEVYEISANPIKDEANQIKGVVHNVRNITKRVEEHTQLQQSYERLSEGMKELQNRNEEITLLVEMSDIMLACSSQKELSDVTSKYSERLLKFAQGYLFIMHPSKNYLELAYTWGHPHAHNPTFSPDECWAIRLGRFHQASNEQGELYCTHITHVDKKTPLTLCVPLMAQNDIYGLLYLEIASNAKTLTENQKLLITAFSELTALALANVRLRENLKYQSIRDPLTGLYNKRYLEDFLLKQLHQAERAKTTFAVLMLDLDHFKKINDTYGHEVGDMVLKEAAETFQQDIRMGDLVARYGGEEFMMLFYHVEEDIAFRMAEKLRVMISKLQIKYGTEQISKVTLSIGLSMYPKDGKTPQELIEAADLALYHSKKTGRDRVTRYSELKK